MSMGIKDNEECRTCSPTPTPTSPLLSFHVLLLSYSVAGMRVIMLLIIMNKLGNYALNYHEQIR